MVEGFVQTFILFSIRCHGNPLMKYFIKISGNKIEFQESWVHADPSDISLFEFCFTVVHPIQDPKAS